MVIKTQFHDPTPNAIFYNTASCAVLSIDIFSYAGEAKIHFSEKDGTMVSIGKFCAIGPNIDFFSAKEHSVQAAATYPFAEKLPDWPLGEEDGACQKKRGGIIIENDVWIGTSAIIRSGVTIHSGSVIGMGAVVTRDVPPYAIVVGNPATVKRLRFPEDMVQRLLQLAWWDWPVDMIKKAAKLLSDPMDYDVLDRLETFKHSESLATLLAGSLEKKT